MANFTNQTAFITGSGSGIGRAAALAFAQAGAHIAVADINEANGQQTVELIWQLGGSAFFVLCDVTRPEQMSSAIQQTVATFGRLDIAVNNAGISGRFARLLDQTVDDFNQVMAVNVGSVFNGMQAQIRQMLRQPEDNFSNRGRIVNVSSIAGVRGMPMGGPYSASKHAIVGLTKTAALEYVKKNIRINAICPVYTHSPMIDELITSSPTLEGRMRKLIPMGRLAQPEEIAQAILWLCDNTNSLFTGQALQMDGGLTAG